MEAARPRYLILKCGVANKNEKNVELKSGTEIHRCSNKTFPATSLREVTSIDNIFTVGQLTSYPSSRVHPLMCNTVFKRRKRPRYFCARLNAYVLFESKMIFFFCNFSVPLRVESPTICAVVAVRQATRVKISTITEKKMGTRYQIDIVPMINSWCTGTTVGQSLLNWIKH